MRAWYSVLGHVLAKSSWLWRLLSQIFPFIQTNLLCITGLGKSTRVWYVPWFRQHPLICYPDIFRMILLQMIRSICWLTLHVNHLYGTRPKLLAQGYTHHLCFDDQNSCGYDTLIMFKCCWNYRIQELRSWFILPQKEGIEVFKLIQVRD